MPLDDSRHPLPTEAQATNSDGEQSRFSVREVESTNTPDGAEGNDWYRYVIDAPGSTITGLRRGSRDEVCDFARTYAEQLEVRTDPRTPGGYGGTRRK